MSDLGRYLLIRDRIDDQHEAFDWVQTEFKERLSLSQHVEAVCHQVDSVLEERGIVVDKESDSYHQLCREMLKASIRVLEVEKERTYGDYS